MEKKAVVYIRVSDPSQIENNSLEVQEKACRNHAKQKGYTVIEPIFKDEGFSAKNIIGRPGMRKLFAYCTNKKNNISYVIVYKMDRWTRNTEEGLAALALLGKFGVELVSATEGIEKNPSGEFLRTILMALGQLDNAMKSERVIDNMKALFNKGIWCWPCPVGYKRPFKTNLENKGKPPIQIDSLVPIIISLFQDAAKNLFSKQQLADKMNQMGFKEQFGSSSSIKMVNRIIKNSFYYGLMYCKKWNKYSKGQHKPIIDENLWIRANNAVFGTRIRYKIQPSDNYPLKGFIKCETCNKLMTSSNPTGRNKSYTHYECGNKLCRKTRILTEAAHEQFKIILGKIKPSQRTLKLFESMVFDEWDKVINIAIKESEVINNRIQRLEVDLKGIRIAMDKGIYNEETAKKEANEINKELLVLRIEKSDIKIDQYNTEKVRNFTEHFLLHFDSLWDRLDDLPMKQALQNKIFPQGIICTKNKEIRTASLSPSFELIMAMNTAEMTSGEA